jgi:hypothetical protein
MLEGLRPAGAREESDEEEEEENDVVHEHGHEHGVQDGRPQFVLAPEVPDAGHAHVQAYEEEGKKVEVEHQEVAAAASDAQAGRVSEEGKRGWKQV